MNMLPHGCGLIWTTNLAATRHEAYNAKNWLPGMHKPVLTPGVQIATWNRSNIHIIHLLFIRIHFHCVHATCTETMEVIDTSSIEGALLVITELLVLEQP